MFEDAPPPAALRLRSLVLECGFSPQVLSDLVKQLPDANLSHALVDYYFTAMYELSVDVRNKCPKEHWQKLYALSTLRASFQDFLPIYLSEWIQPPTFRHTLLASPLCRPCFVHAFISRSYWEQ